MKTPPLLLLLGSFLLLAVPLAAQPAAPGLVAASHLPQNNAPAVCPDTQLALTFAGTPTLGNTGQVRIYDASDNQLVETIDTGIPVTAQNYVIGGANDFRLYPILINGHTATIFPHNHKLDYHKTYYVQMDPGAILVDGQPFPGFSGNTGWVFTTKAAPPAKDATRLVVAADGTGDFATVQGAVDFVPDQPVSPVTIFIRQGLYVEIVYFEHKSNLTFLGDDRAGTVIGYPNNDRFNNQQNTNEKPTTSAYHRGAFFANHSTGLNFVNLTFRNSTPKGGSQAEALILTGGQNIISHCSFYSYQDTLQINDSAYVADSYVEGDTDYMWGRGPVFFEHCELKALTSGAPYTQIRNPAANHGYIYNHCVFDAAPGMANVTLARIAPATYPYSEVVLLDCQLGPQISPAAWRLDTAARGGAAVGAAAFPPTPNLHFWEYNSTNISDGQPADVSQRAPFSKQLTMANDADTIKNYRDPAFVLGWTPALAPIILAPVSFDINTSDHATATTFTVTAAAVPAPSYQWLHHGVAVKDGDGVSGATTATLKLSNASSVGVEDYSVVVTNAFGTVKSP